MTEQSYPAHEGLAISGLARGVLEIRRDRRDPREPIPQKHERHARFSR